MKKMSIFPMACVLALCVGPASAPATHPSAPIAPRYQKRYGDLSLRFEANGGQTDPRVDFLARGNGYTIFLGGTDATLVLTKPSGAANRKFDRSKPRAAAPKDETFTSVALRFRLLGANTNPRLQGAEPKPSSVHYIIGEEPSARRFQVPSFAKVKVAGAYEGIDLVYYGNQRQVEYDFLVAPGADPARIAMEIDGADRVELAPNGDLRLCVGGDEVRLQKPIAYQTIDGKRKDVEVGYVLCDGDEVRFKLGGYDPAAELTIDPIIGYSSFFGGNALESGLAIAVDTDGNAVVVGSTASTNFRDTSGVFDRSHNGGNDVFVTKFNPEGSDVVFSTFIGGGGNDVAYDVVLDPMGYIFVTGATDSESFPTTNGADDRTFNGGTDAFVLKLMPDGSDLVFSTFLGGEMEDAGFGIAIDGDGNSFVTGETNSEDFPTFPAAAFDTTFNGGWDAFVTKLNSDGTDIIYSTFIGSSGDESGLGIAMAMMDYVYITGGTSSTNFPTTADAFDRSLDGPSDAFVTQLNSDGSDLEYSTFLGGVGEETGFAITGNLAGEAFVTGETDSFNFPTTDNAFRMLPQGGWDAFVTKLNAEGSDLIYSTFLGGSADDSGFAIAINDAEHAYVTGKTESFNFPTTKGAPFESDNPLTDVFVSKLTSSGSGLLYSTYLGGRSVECGFGIAVDMMGNAYVTGETDSFNFPTLDGSLDRSYNGGGDLFVTKLAESFGPIHDLAVTDIKGPKRIKLSAKKPSRTVIIEVTIQNRSQHDEIVEDMATLEALASLAVSSLGACPDLVATLVSIDTGLPVQLSPKQKAVLFFEVTFDCANDPLKAKKKDPGHEDFTLVATVDHTAIDGEADDHPEDDICPHDALPGETDPHPDGTIRDKGCGGKKPDKTRGADVFVDVLVK